MEQENQNFLQPIFNFFRGIFSGKTEEEESVIEESTDTQLTLDEQYMSRFDGFSLQNLEQLKGREESYQLLEKAYLSWQKTKNPLLMVSEPGMGSSSLLHSTTKLYPDAVILEDSVNFFSRQQLINLIQQQLQIDGDFESFDQLAKQVTKEKVVIFENIERLFLRKVGGFHLLDDFILFVHATKHKVYWVLTINRYSFYYLDRVRDFSSNFNSILYLKSVENQLISTIIKERNEGYHLKYLVPTDIKNQSNFKELSAEQKQQYLEESFTKKLLSFADGNISRALLFWRKSVRRTQDQNIYLKPFEPKELSDLKLEEVLILEAIMQHNSLSADELQDVFRNSSKGSKLAIEKLMEKDAIIFKEYHNSAAREYQINPLYTPVVKAVIRNRLNRNFI